MTHNQNDHTDVKVVYGQDQWVGCTRLQTGSAPGLTTSGLKYGRTLHVQLSVSGMISLSVYLHCGILATEGYHSPPSTLTAPPPPIN